MKRNGRDFVRLRKLHSRHTKMLDHKGSDAILFVSEAYERGDVVTTIYELAIRGGWISLIGKEQFGYHQYAFGEYPQIDIGAFETPDQIVTDALSRLSTAKKSTSRCRVDLRSRPDSKATHSGGVRCAAREAMQAEVAGITVEEAVTLHGAAVSGAAAGEQFSELIRDFGAASESAASAFLDLGIALASTEEGWGD